MCSFSARKARLIAITKRVAAFSADSSESVVRSAWVCGQRWWGRGLRNCGSGPCAVLCADRALISCNAIRRPRNHFCSPLRCLRRRGCGAFARWCRRCLSGWSSPLSFTCGRTTRGVGDARGPAFSGAVSRDDRATSGETDATVHVVRAARSTSTDTMECIRAFSNRLSSGRTRALTSTAGRSRHAKSSRTGVPGGGDLYVPVTALWLRRDSLAHWALLGTSERVRSNRMNVWSLLSEFEGCGLRAAEGNYEGPGIPVESS